MDTLFVLITGAVTYLTVRGFSKERKNNGVGELAVYLMETGLATILGWLYFHAKGEAGEEIIEEGHLFVALTGKNIIVMMVIAFLLGLAIAFIRSMKPEIHFDLEKPGIWESLDNKKKMIVKSVVLMVTLLAMVAIVAGPSVKEAREKAIKSDFKASVTELLDDLKTEVADELKAGTSVENLATLMVDQVEIYRVDKDQHWNSKSEDGKIHAVYMVDGKGNVVYLSYKDKNFCVTWSGPCSDEDFLATHGTWNGGNGWGWTGSVMKN